MILRYHLCFNSALRVNVSAARYVLSVLYVSALDMRSEHHLTAQICGGGGGLRRR